MPVRGIHHHKVRVRVRQGQRRQQFEAPLRAQLLGPEVRDVLEAVDLEPGFAEQRPTVAAGDEGQVLGHQVADTEVPLGLVDVHRVHQRTGLPKHFDARIGVPGDGPPPGFIRPLRARASAVRWSCRAPVTRRSPPRRTESEVAEGERVPASGDMELVC